MIDDGLLALYGHYPTRICRTLHGCRECGENIEYGDEYFDGGYGRRAHVKCVDPEGRYPRPVKTDK